MKELINVLKSRQIRFKIFHLKSIGTQNDDSSSCNVRILLATNTSIQFDYL